MRAFTSIYNKLFIIVALLVFFLVCSFILGISIGSSGGAGEALKALLGRGEPDTTLLVIIWKIRFPRVVLAATVGAVLSLGGLVFQALLRNPLAEPYILGISGGSAVGAICGMLYGLSLFPGVTFTAFGGSILTLTLILGLTTGRAGLRKNSLLLGGVMMNAFCGAIIMFLISLSQSSQVHHILFWLMGDLSMMEAERIPLLITVIPCFIIIFMLARPMNLLLTGTEDAASLGVNVRLISLTLLVTTSLMVSLVVSLSGLIGFVGLTIPHIFRLFLGPDHRLLVPACILGGSSYLIICDLLARSLPVEGEMPVGIITAIVGAPLFIFLLWRVKR